MLSETAITLHVRWSAHTPPVETAAGIAAALQQGRRGKAAVHRAAGAVLCAAPAPHGWRPAESRRMGRVLFHGRITNRRDVAARLELPERDDAGLYAAAWDAWGERADRELVGHYAAILHEPGSRLATLVRSPIAAPPLHVWQGDGQAIAATTPRAIFATGLVRREVDEEKVADALFLNYLDMERGWFTSVRRLPVGTRARLSPDGMALERYYDLERLPPVHLPTDADYVEQADRLMDEAVTAAMDGLRQPGLLLSGGHDSQLIAAHAIRLRGDRPLHGFTAVPGEDWDGTSTKGRFGNEAPYVRALAEMHPSLRPHFIASAGLGLDHRLRDLIEMAQLAPRSPMNFHWMHACLEAAAAEGCDGLLSGGLGNATVSFGGKAALAGWLLEGDWRRLVRNIGWLRPRQLLGDLILPLVPAGVWRRIKRLHDDAGDPFESWCAMNPDYARRMRVAERAAAAGYDPDYQPRRSGREHQRFQLTAVAGEIGDLYDGLECLHGLPMRTVYVHRPLVEFCLGIPMDQFRRRGEDRWLSRRLLRGKVPEMVLRERRRGQQAADWRPRLDRSYAAILDELDRLAGDPAMADRIDVAGLRRFLLDHPPGTPVTGPARLRMRYALPRALAVARFIRYVEGRNDP